MKKKCLSCGATFTLSGSGRRQKYCRTCAQRGIGPERGLVASKSLKSKAAKSASEFTDPVDLMNGRWRGKVERKLRHTILGLELAPPLKGFTLNLVIEDEAPLIGCGYRLVLCKLRGKRVALHHAGYTATIKREAFKDLVRANKRRRQRNNNIIQFPVRHEPIELELVA